MIRVGLIGAGRWGLNHVRIVSTDPSCALVSVADPDPAAIARVRESAPRVATTPDAHELLADRAIDAVIIASPARSHAPLAIAALAAGKHVLVEKPLAMTVDDALAVARAQQRSVAMVGHLMVYHPAVVRLHELLQAGELGPLHYLYSTRANLGGGLRDDSVLWTLGPHDLSMIDYLMQRRSPCDVSARGYSASRGAADDVVFLTLRYRSGELAHVRLSRLSARKERRLTLVSGNEVSEFDELAAQPLARYRSRPLAPLESTPAADREPLRLQLEHFVTCIRDRLEPWTDLASAVRITAVLDAARRSIAAQGESVPVAMPSWGASRI